VRTGGHRDHPAGRPGGRLLDPGSPRRPVRCWRRPRSSAQQYWSGAVFIGAGALPLIESALGPSEMLVTWVYAAALGGLTAEPGEQLDASLDSLASSGATFLASGIPVTVAVTSQIPSILSPFTAGESAAAPVLELLYVSLAVWGRWWCCSAPGWWRSAAPPSSRSCEPGARRCISSAGWCCAPA
jgi:hypothetical protein